MSIFACKCCDKNEVAQVEIPRVDSPLEEDTVPKVRHVLSQNHEDLLKTARQVTLKGSHAVVVFSADTRFPTERKDALELFRAVRNIKDG